MTTAQKEKKEKEDRRQKKVKEKQKRMEKEREVPSSAEGKPDLRVRVAGRKGEVPSCARVAELPMLAFAKKYQ